MAPPTGLDFEDEKFLIYVCHYALTLFSER